MNSQTHRSSFATQYTSLMLIILSVVVSSRFQFMEQRRAFAEQPQATKQVVIPPIGQMSFNDLFPEGRASLIPIQVQAILSLLESHDVNAHFTIFLPVEFAHENREMGLSLALARAVNIRDFFNGKGDWGQSVSVTVLERISGTLAESVQAEIDFYHDGDATHE